MNNSTCLNVAWPGRGPGPFQPPLRAGLPRFRGGVGSTHRGTGRGAPAVRLPADLGLLDREGWTVNKKAVRRLYRELGLKVAQPRANPKPRLRAWTRQECLPSPALRGKDDVWTWDFLFDRTSDGRSLKWLSIVDEYTRECLALEARRGMTAEDIRIILAEVAAGRGGPPCRMRSDNGPEFVAEVVRSWLEETGSGSLPVAPGSPWQNGYAESFHSKVRDEFLNREEFESEPQARALARSGKGSIIPNARTVPWDIRHRPN